MITGTGIVIALLSLLAVIVLTMAVRIVPEFRRLVVFRLGRCVGPRGPARGLFRRATPDLHHCRQRLGFD